MAQIHFKYDAAHPREGFVVELPASKVTEDKSGITANVGGTVVWWSHELVSVMWIERAGGAR